MNRVTLGTGLLFLLALGLSLPEWLSTEAPTQKSETEEAWVPNYQAKAMLSTLYNKNGKINHQVYAEKMEHFDLLGFTLFKQPQYVLFAQAQYPWRINAAEGTLYDDQRLQFENSVEINSLNEQGMVQVIRTDFVEVDLEAKTMVSDQLVNIAGPNYVIDSNGFSVSLETQQYELLDHVKTIYQPEP
ncbi:MAG: LPS export ABC transporter periplasmic protein LptC [Paraglaciecola sp.]|nr:LPS export ABC transporter periplasmic protein LptC [Paraglaciecola sp.]NCT46996.1 LPS export ABC transporter periplasmic protein LptC [Paraglaciecola sp.]